MHTLDNSLTEQVKGTDDNFNKNSLSIALSDGRTISLEIQGEAIIKVADIYY